MPRVVLFGIALLACEAPRPAECALRVLVPDGVSAPVGGATDLTVRFFNSSSKPVAVDGLEVTGDELRIVSDARALRLSPGSCEAPTEVGLVVRFTPSRVGRRASELRFLLDQAPSTVTLETNGLGPLLASAEVVNLGLTGLRPWSGRLELLNDGTLGTTLEAHLESISPASPATTTDELCLGAVRDGLCVPGAPVTVARRTSVELVATPRTPGAKAWTVTFAAGSQRTTTRVLADVVDTSGCQLEPSVSRVAFGMTLAPDRSTQRVTFTNVGSGPCVLRGATVSPPFLVTGRAPLRLEPREAFALGVEVSLPRPMSARGRLEVAVATSASSQLPVSAVELVAETPADCLVTTPSSIDFGSAATGCSTRERTVFLTNRCSSPLLVTGLRADAPFIVSSAFVSLPHVFQPAEQQRVVLRGRVPSAVGAVTGRLVIDLDPGEAVVSLFGRAEPRPLRTDTFAFERRPDVDVLFVLDDSPSFLRQHQRVRGELARFRQWAEARSCGMNLRVGFTTTDVTAAGPRGRLRVADGGTTWASGDAPDFAATFDELGVLSTAGAEHQSCLEASARAVSEPLASSANRGFRRAGSALSIVCATDDVDPVADPTPGRAALRSDGGFVSYSVMGPIGSACEVDALDDGGTHAANVTPLDGVLGDICAPWDIYPFDSFGCSWRTTFFLSAVPDAAGVSVALDGRAVPERSGAQVNWRYDASTNAVVLEPSVLGRDPRALVVSYETACLP